MTKVELLGVPLLEAAPDKGLYGLKLKFALRHGMEE